MTGQSESEGTRTDARVGTILADRYRIDALLGEGGMGRVYGAEHVLMRKRLAVKVLHRELTMVPEVVARFEREAMAAANIDHPNVAAATDFGKLPDGSVFLVLEYVQGKNLRDEVAQGPFELERALHIARQIAAGLASAHALDIVHRDLKPENVMLVERATDADFVKVLDFGIAKVPIGNASAPGSMQNGQPITKVGMVFGTPEYMAPEQALGQAVDGRADLYALGVILFEMLAGLRPFTSKSQIGILGQQLSQPAPKVSERSPGIVVPAQVEQIIQKLLAKEVTERYQKAEEVVDAIGILLGAPAGRGPYRFTMAAGSPMSARASRPSFASNPGSLAVVSPSVPSPAPRDSQADWPFGEQGTGAETSDGAPPAELRVEPLSEFIEALDGSHQAEPGLERVVERARSPRIDAALDFVDAATRKLPTPLRRPLRRLPPPALLGVAALVVVAAIGAVVVGLVAIFRSSSPEPSAPLAASTAAPSAPAQPAAPSAAPAPTQTEPTGATTTAALEALAKQRPDDAAVQADLAVALAADKRLAAAVAAAGKALASDAAVCEDRRIGALLLQAARERDAPAETFTLLEGPMGQQGADVIYELALGEGGRKDVRARAERWLGSTDFARVSSPALNIAVALRKTKTCEQRYGLLLRAKNVGDERSVPELEKWKNTDGCGPKGDQDCNPCLRVDDRLDQALSHARARRAL